MNRLPALSVLRAALAAAVETLPDEDLPAAQAAVREADTRLLQRVVAAAARPPAVHLLTVDEACEIARMPRRRLFSRSRHATWAVRFGRRLLVEESGFRRWLAEMGPKVPGEHEHARATDSDDSDPEKGSLMSIRASQSRAGRLAPARRLVS
jgi:hypothetical protein